MTSSYFSNFVPEMLSCALTDRRCEVVEKVSAFALHNSIRYFLLFLQVGTTNKSNTITNEIDISSIAFLIIILQLII